MPSLVRAPVLVPVLVAVPDAAHGAPSGRVAQDDALDVAEGSSSFPRLAGEAPLFDNPATISRINRRTGHEPRCVAAQCVRLLSFCYAPFCVRLTVPRR